MGAEFYAQIEAFFGIGVLSESLLPSLLKGFAGEIGSISSRFGQRFCEIRTIVSDA